MLAKLGKYTLTGGAAAIVDAVGFWLATSAGVSLPVAAVGSFLIAALLNYALTSAYVFQARRTIRGLSRFVVFATLGLAINVTATLLAARFLGGPAVIAKLIGIAIAFTANFFLNVVFVFRESDDMPPQPPK